jgi:hypothetical protein
VRKPVARADHEIIESVIRVKFERPARRLGTLGLGRFIAYAEFYTDQVPRDLLGSLGENTATIIIQKLHCNFVRAADFQQAAAEIHKSQLIEPLTRIYRVKSLCTLKNLGENFQITSSQYNNSTSTKTMKN